MPKLHLLALEAALSRRGWRIVAVRAGNDYDVSATWQIQRTASEPSLFIDFCGMGRDGDVCLPLQDSYGCSLRGHASVDLYFRRVNRSRELWEKELSDFVQALDEAS
jgi:hypothetical protein